MLVKNIVKFFDKLENKVRGKLSHYPIIYGFLGGVGVVLFWRGVWHTSDDLGLGSVESIILGSIILLITGVFVSTFIGNKIIISGLMSEEKLSKKEEKEIQEEIQAEEKDLQEMQQTLKKVEKKVSDIEEEVEKK